MASPSPRHAARSPEGPRRSCVPFVKQSRIMVTFASSDFRRVPESQSPEIRTLLIHNIDNREENPSEDHRDDYRGGEVGFRVARTRSTSTVRERWAYASCSAASIVLRPSAANFASSCE